MGGRSAWSEGTPTLAGAIDDVVDHAEETADFLGLYGIEAPMEQAVEMSTVLVGASAALARAIASLRGPNDLASHLVQIHQLENEGDRISRDARALHGAHRSNGRDSLEGRFRVPRARRGLMRDGRAHPRGVDLKRGR